MSTRATQRMMAMAVLVMAVAWALWPKDSTASGASHFEREVPADISDGRDAESLEDSEAWTSSTSNVAS